MILYISLPCSRKIPCRTIRSKTCSPVSQAMCFARRRTSGGGFARWQSSSRRKWPRAAARMRSFRGVRCCAFSWKSGVQCRKPAPSSRSRSYRGQQDSGHSALSGSQSCRRHLHRRSGRAIFYQQIPYDAPLPRGDRTSIHNYLSDKRLLAARDLIQSGLSATDACFRCGFRSYSAFSRAYGKLFGATPTGRIVQTLHADDFDE